MPSTTNRPKKWFQGRYFGAFMCDMDFIGMITSNNRRIEKPPFMIPNRPERYHSFANRVLQAIDVFKGKADALYWPEDLASGDLEVEMNDNEFLYFTRFFLSQLPHDWDRQSFMGVRIIRV